MTPGPVWATPAAPADRWREVGVSPRLVALTRVRAAALAAARAYFTGAGFLEIAATPAVGGVVGTCEEPRTVFPVDWYGRKAFLAQTGQPYLELLIRGPLARVYAVNQSFRRETDGAGRRLSVFALIEAELARCDLAALQDVQEALIGVIVEHVVRQEGAALRTLGGQPDALAEQEAAPFPRIPYREAIARLNLPWGADLDSAAEQRLVAALGGGPVFLERWPTAMKYFNMQADPEDPDLCLSSDLILPGAGEAIGSAVREPRADVLAAQLAAYVAQPDRLAAIRTLGFADGAAFAAEYAWYVALHATPTPVPHAGFGLGFERLIQWLIGTPDIRECVEFVRTAEHLTP